MQTHHVFTISSSSLAHVWTCLLATLRARWGLRSDLCWVTFAKVRSDICHLQSMILKKTFHTAKCFLSLCGAWPAPTSCEPADVENSTEDSKAREMVQLPDGRNWGPWVTSGRNNIYPSDIRLQREWEISLFYDLATKQQQQCADTRLSCISL